MPRTRKSKQYFTKDTEEAIIEYNSIDDKRTKDKIYKERIQPAFAKLAEILGHPEWASNEKYQTNTARIGNREEVDTMVGEELKKIHSSELIPLLRKNGIPVGPVNTVAEALATEHTLAREMIIKHPHPSIGELKTLGTPLKMHQTPTVVRYPPPRLGEHTQEVLSEYLDEKRIAELRLLKVIS